MKKLAIVTHSLILLCLLLLIAEFISYLNYVPIGHELIATEKYINSNTKLAQKKCNDNLLCYKVYYHYDDLGNRRLPKMKKEKHLIILGDSIAFGEGLDIEDTFSYQLNQNTEYQVFNFAKPGTGPNYALYQLKKQDAIESIFPKTGVAVFLLFNYHIDRMSYNTRRYWAWNAPTYYFQAGKLIEYENQLAQIKGKEWFYHSMYWLNYNSYFFKQFHLYFSPTTYEENLTTFLAVIKEAKRIYESHFQGEFIVLGAPVFSPSEEVINKLRQNNIKFIALDTENYFYERLCSCDPHPSAKSNESLFKLIKSELEK